MKKTFIAQDRDGKEYYTKASSEQEAIANLIAEYGDLGFYISAAQG